MGILRRRAVLVAAVLIVLLAVGGGGVWLYARAAAPSVRYRTAAATFGTVTQTLGMSGNLAAANQTSINFPVSGQVNAVNVQPGQVVQGGAALASVDPTNLQNSLTLAQAQLGSAQAKLASDQAVQAAPTPTPSANQQSQAQNPAVLAAQVQQDQAQVAIDTANVATAQRQLDQATLTAPTGGMVLQVNIAVGQNVSASGASSGGGGGASPAGTSAAASGSASTSGSSTAAIIIMQPGQFNVTGSVSDAEIGQVAVGQSVEVTPAGSATALLGTVTGIAPQATVASGVATFPVTVQITNPPASLRPGISASVSIIVNRAVHVLTVPTAAVHTTTAGSTVQVLSGVTASSVSVQLGAQDPTSTQILSGLSAGQQVVIATISSAVPTGGSGNPLGGGRTGGGRTGGAGGGAGGGGGRTGGGGQ